MWRSRPRSCEKSGRKNSIRMFLGKPSTDLTTKRALDGHEVLIDTLKVTPNRYPYTRTVASSGEEKKILSVLNAYDFSHDLGRELLFEMIESYDAIEGIADAEPLPTDVARSTACWRSGPQPGLRPDHSGSRARISITLHSAMRPVAHALSIRLTSTRSAVRRAIFSSIETRCAYAMASTDAQG
jgi:hypothetical protein